MFSNAASTRSSWLTSSSAAPVSRQTSRMSWSASRALRRGPAWGCGFSDPVPAAQYSGAGFAQPIRRVFGTLVFYARDHVDMPAPGDTRPARFRIELHDPIWEGIYQPIAAAVGLASERLNHLQFLTIRRYLSLVFATLVTLLLVLAIWS